MITPIQWLLATLVLLAGVIGTPKSYAAPIGKAGGLSIVGRTGTTAEGVVASAGGDFARLLAQPSTVLSGGDTTFQTLLDMPFKPKDFPPDKATLKGLVTGKNLAKALRGGLGAYVAGEAISALIKQACVRGMGGTLVMNESATFEECKPGSAPEVSTGTEWRASNNYGFASGWKPTREASCSASAPPGGYTTYDPAGFCFGYQSNGSYVFGVGFESRGANCGAGTYPLAGGACSPTPPPATIEYQPVSTEQAESKIEDAIKNPANAGKVIPALKELIDKGGQVEVSPPTVTGPASSPASTTTITNTTQTTNGPVTNTTNITNTTNYTYNGSTVTASQVTNSTTKDPQGSTVGQSTTQAAPLPASTTPDTPEQTPTDAPMPPVPNLYERKYPDGLVGIWNDYSQQFKQSALPQLVNQLMPQVPTGGQCPSFMIPLDFASWANFGSHNLAPPCWIWDFCKAVVLFGAVLLSRALVFGG